MPVSTRRGSVVTIGVYDGLHLGHRTVIADVCRLARREGLESVVVTFDRHPASVVRPETAPLQLTDLPHRIELLGATGIDDVTVIEFTPARAHETAEEFVEEVLVGELSARVVVVGKDFHFGRNRGGNVALLAAMGADRGFRVEPFELVTDPVRGGVVSSTRIRGLVAEAALDEAARLLGRSHEVRGLVVAEEAADRASERGPAGVRVAIPSNLLLPPPGDYHGRAGLVGGAGVPLQPVHVVVFSPAQRALGSGAVELTVLGLAAPYPIGSPVRVLFDVPIGA